MERQKKNPPHRADAIGFGLKLAQSTRMTRPEPHYIHIGKKNGNKEKANASLLVSSHERSEVNYMCITVQRRLCRHITA